MKRTTKKLFGIGLELFLRRFYASYSGIDDALAAQLSKDGAETFASVRVRRVAWRDWRGRQAFGRPEALGRRLVGVPRSASATAAVKHNPEPTPVDVATAAEAALPAVDAAAFDPYAIGLIPTYQREGADGLMAKLAAIASIDNLRKMARSQQVALPAELRGPDADIDAIRGAIVAAVGKRIADRRAAAG